MLNLTMDNFEAAKQFFLEGLQLLQANNFRAAETQFARSLELIPDRVSTLNNLSAVKLKRRQFAEAEQYALKAIAVDSQSPEAWSNLGIALTGMERHQEALQACDRALNRDASFTRVWLTKAMALLRLTRYDEALLACDEALKLDSSQEEIVYTRSLILKELNRPNEARECYRKSLEMRLASSPVFVGERRATQKANALVVNPNPALDDSFRSFEQLSRFCSNYPCQLGDYLLEDFHFTYVFVGDTARPPARKQIPPPDFVINNHVNGEVLVSEGNLPDLIQLVESFGVPVVNHPTKAVPTARDLSAKLIEGIPGVRLPRTLRFSRVGKTCEALVREIEERYDYPLITRTLTAQEGKGMTKVDSRAALAAVLSDGCPDKFFVTQFVDSRGGNKFFRKIRAAVVQDEIIIVRVDYDHFWKIYARKSDERVAFYLNNADLLDAEKRICADPEAGLGRSAVQSLRAIRRRIPLDVFGIDFDVAPDGRVVFYEANATMNLFSTAREEVPYPKEAGDHLKLAFQRYFTSLVARRSAKS